jgi:hypothetical protein
MSKWYPPLPWESRQPIYASPFRDVSYICGRPLPFEPKLANKIDSDDPAIRKEAWEEVERRFG